MLIESAGIKNTNNVYTLDTKYNIPNNFYIYYGQLEYSGISDWSKYNMVAIADRTPSQVAIVRSSGVKVFQYIAFGSQFQDTTLWLDSIKAEVLTLKNSSLADGIFWDECDVGYWDLNGYDNPSQCAIFGDALKELCDYCESIGVETICNGVRAFVDTGTYWLWESFLGYWNLDGSYPYYNLEDTNGDADTNLQMYNYNKVQLNWLLDRKASNVIAHSYGLESDDLKIKYMYVASKMFESFAWDYCERTHQQIYGLDFLNKPLGKILTRTKLSDTKFTAVFTNAVAEIDTGLAHSCDLVRDEPSYWYENGRSMDGAFTDWQISDKIWTNPKSFLAHMYILGLYTDFTGGTYVNCHDAGGYLDLVINGAGSWISPELSPPYSNRIFNMNEITWDGADAGVTLQVKYKRTDLTWSDWISVSKEQIVNNEEFISCQLKVELSGDVGVNTFWGYSLFFDLKLLDSVNIKHLSVYDDNFNFYISYEADEAIDFDLHKYNIYIDTTNDLSGFKGTLWNTSIGVQYWISNYGLYVWEDSAWKWLGESNVSYVKSSDGKKVEMAIKKAVLGSIPSESMNIYMYVEEDTTFYGALIDPEGTDLLLSPVGFTGHKEYTQKSFQLFSPHGYEIVESNLNNSSAIIRFEKNQPTGTDAKMYIRTYKNGSYGVWEDVSSNSIIPNCDKVQYLISLSTLDGSVSPSISDVSINSISVRNLDYLNLITSQHRFQPKFISWTSVFLEKLDDIYGLNNTVDTLFDIDVAVGYQLDTLGAIVGISRYLDFQPSGSVSPVLSDEELRFIIKAKINKNHWNGTLSNLFDLWEASFPDFDLTIQDNQDMSCTVQLGDIKSYESIKKDLLIHHYIIPKPQGVQMQIAFQGSFQFFKAGDTDGATTGFSDVNQVIGGYLGGVYK